jgi:prepilin-type N-terminal cleavage/methylation domain-containing protein
MKKNAFTLFEMLLALLLVGLASSFSVVFVNNKHYQLNTYAKSFYHAFRLARVESIVLGESVAVAPYDKSTHELSADWCKGWVMFKEPFSRGAILQTHVGAYSCAANWRSFPSRDHLIFLPLGMTKYQNASLTLQGDQLYKIYVSQTGRIRM